MEINWKEAFAPQDSGRIKRLHPTLKRCRCGLVDSKYKVEQHIDHELASRNDGAAFWQRHGEVPLNEDEA